jgi:DNA-binding winged helix-turn-helix (wHTH) protein
MPNLRAWDRYPDTYRTNEMSLLAQWILACESGSVIGLPGCGRSNLLNFLSYRPDILQQYLPPEAEPIAVVLVDLNHLPATDATTLYLVILRAIYWARYRFPTSLQQGIAECYQEHRTTQSPFLAQSALYELLVTFQAEGLQLVLVFNHLDRFAQSTTPQILNTLRGLRDSFKDTICFIAGMAQEATYLPNPEALGDMLSGMLQYQVCWVGAMNEADARLVIHQTTHTAPQPPGEAEIQAMLDLTGGFPALLRAVCAWWLNRPAKPPMTEWPEALVAEPLVRHQLVRLWHGLTQAEQFALTTIWREQQEKLVKQKKTKTIVMLHHLTEKGLCAKNGSSWQVRGELLAAYIAQVGSQSRGGLRLEEKTREIFQGQTLLRNLTPQEDKLLRFMLQQEAHKEFTYEDLINVIWTEDQAGTVGILPGHVQQIVSKLREKIGDDASHPHFIVTWGRNPKGGYKLYPEGRPAEAE